MFACFSLLCSTSTIHRNTPPHRLSFPASLRPGQPLACSGGTHMSAEPTTDLMLWHWLAWGEPIKHRTRYHSYIFAPPSRAEPFPTISIQPFPLTPAIHKPSVSASLSVKLQPSSVRLPVHFPLPHFHASSSAFHRYLLSTFLLHRPLPATILFRLIIHFPHYLICDH